MCRIDADISNKSYWLFYLGPQAAGDRNNQIVIENLKHDGQIPVAVKNSDSRPVLQSISGGDTWV